MEATESLGIFVCPMEESDLDEVYAVEVETFTDPWGKGAFVGSLGEDWAANLVAVCDGRIVGYIIAVGVADELHIHNIAVRQSFRGRGIGKLLLADAEKWARENEKLCSFLEVRASNEAAKALYISNGYEKIGFRRRYYSKPVEDALVLMKILQSFSPLEAKR